MGATVRITQLDGKLPNLALMKLCHWHKKQGDTVHFTRTAVPDLFEPKDYDKVYGATIFKFNNKKTDLFKQNYPQAIIGGTGSDNTYTIEEYLKIPDYEYYDYSSYPEFKNSVGFTQRGCRLKCKFCVVPTKEGKNRHLNTIHNIWRGEPHPKNILLLDNDFFGQPNWQKVSDEIVDGKFKICFSQGINIRLINDETAQALTRIPYYDDSFKRKRLYTAWDNIGDEKIFFQGVETLQHHGIPAKHLMVYMLIGYKPKETWDEIFYRFNKMVQYGISPYPMVYDNANKELKRFQRWVIRRYYEYIPWNMYSTKKRPFFSQHQLQLELED